MGARKELILEKSSWPGEASNASLSFVTHFLGNRSREAQFSYGRLGIRDSLKRKQVLRGSVHGLGRLENGEKGKGEEPRDPEKTKKAHVRANGARWRDAIQ